MADFEQKIDDVLDSRAFFEEFIRGAARMAGMQIISIHENPVKKSNDIQALQLRGGRERLPDKEGASQYPVVAIFRLKPNNDVHIDTLGYSNTLLGYYTEFEVNIAQPDSIERMAQAIKRTLDNPEKMR